MAKKVALLIGVSEYQSGFTPLPASIGDIDAMQRVLKNPEIGGFDEIKILKNPSSQLMSEAIEDLFASRRTDDLVLLFFSGHGGKLANNKLYFATSNTRKNSNNNTEVVISTAVTASFVNQIMSNSASRYQVLILDCCYSGAFTNDLYVKNDGSESIKNQLGGEGRVIITSSAFTEYSYEQEGGDISLFTRYIVEGLEDGVADRDDDGWISVYELYDYAKDQVRKAAPKMSPRIYAVREGFNIKLAKSSTDDPKKIYHQEVEFLVRNGDGQISDTGRDLLNELKNEYLINTEEASAIEEKVLKPYKDLKEKSKRYQSRFRREIQQRYPISNQTREELIRLGKILQLTDEKIALIENQVIEERQQNLLEYEQAFRFAIEQSYPVKHLDSGLIELQQRLQLKDENIRAIEAPIIAFKESRLQEYENKFTQVVKQTSSINRQAKRNLQELKNSLELKDDEASRIEQRVIAKIKQEKNFNRKLKIGQFIIGILLIILIIIGYFFTPTAIILVSDYRKEQSLPDAKMKMSWGEKNLLDTDRNDNKKQAQQAFEKGNYPTALNYFKEAIKNNPIDDPEALIGYNNANAHIQANSDNKLILSIAVSVPIGNNPDIAKQILRGVSLAQKDVNDNGGIRFSKNANESPRFLNVLIADDSNEPKMAVKIAKELVKNKSNFSNVLAIVGHNSSNTSLKAAPIYQDGGLVMITPTSDAREITAFGPPVFHIMPFLERIAEKLANHVSRDSNIEKIAICADLSSRASESHERVFSIAIRDERNRLLSGKPCIISDNFDTDKIIEELEKDKVNTILLLPAVEKINKAIELAKKAHDKGWKLLGSPTMNTNQTLAEGKYFKDMLIPVPWNHKEGNDKSNSFNVTKQDLKVANVTWRTAMAYDTTQAIVKAFEEIINNRKEINRTNLRDRLSRKGFRLGLDNNKDFSQQKFSLKPVTGEVNFRGEREAEVSILQVKEDSENPGKYIFDSIPTEKVQFQAEF